MGKQGSVRNKVMRERILPRVEFCGDFPDLIL